jgi:hypothetical protein
MRRFSTLFVTATLPSSTGQPRLDFALLTGVEKIGPGRQAHSVEQWKRLQAFRAVRGRFGRAMYGERSNWNANCLSVCVGGKHMTPSSKNTHLMHLVALGTIVLAGCAAGDPRFTIDAPAGFFAGWWHGLIAFVTLVIGLFNDSVEVYERFNSGGWYDFGFLLGVGCCAGSGHKTHKKWRCRTNGGASPTAMP